MLQQLRHLEPFTTLDLPALRTVAQQTTLIDLPPGRRLDQSGQLPAGNFYLLRGKLRDQRSKTVLTADASPLIADSAHLVTLTQARLLHVNIEPVAFLLRDSSLEPLAESVDEDSWQIRFLRSHMLSPFDPQHWQKILCSLTARVCEAGEWLFRRGDEAAACFIVAEGTGRIVRRGQHLRALQPGDFFGEDALLGTGTRNACVQMLSAGKVMQLDLRNFHDWLADLLIAGAGLEQLHSNQSCERLRVQPGEDVRQQIEALDPCVRYLVEGDLRASRLAVFLLRQRGIRAELAQADTVRSFAQVRSAAMDSPRITDIG